MADESGRAVKVYRLDGGAPKDRGIYRCSECSWVGHEVGRSAPHSHAQSKHGGRGVDVVRAVPQTRGKRRLSTKPRAIRDREQKSRKSHGEMVSGCFTALALGESWPHHVDHDAVCGAGRVHPQQTSK